MGRIVKDYGYYIRGSYSVNAAHSNTSVLSSVHYDSVKKRVRLLEKVAWYVKADIKNGFSQFGTNPAH